MQLKLSTQLNVIPIIFEPVISIFKPFFEIHTGFIMEDPTGLLDA
jgi:hypothetical protein